MVNNPSNTIELQENKHHNVPGSRTGSGKPVNLSWVPVERHAGYHSITVNRLPTEVISTTCLLAIGRVNASLDPDSLNNILDRTIKSEWSDDYNDSAFQPYDAPDLRPRFEKSFKFTANFLREQELFADRLLLTLNEGSPHFLFKNNIMGTRLEQFFNVNDPMLVIKWSKIV